MKLILSTLILASLSATGTAGSLRNLQDTTPPTAVCQPGPVNISSSGNCAPVLVADIDPTDIDNGSTDDIGITSRSVIFPNGETELSVDNTYTVTLTVADAEGNIATCDTTVSIQDVDSDSDNILDCDDLCPDSDLDDVDSLKFNRFQYDSASGVNFSTGGGKGKGKGNQKTFDIIQTQGCTCEDIVEVCEYGKGHLKFGCSSGVMDLFVDPSGPFCEDEYGYTYPAFD